MTSWLSSASTAAGLACDSHHFALEGIYQWLAPSILAAEPSQPRPDPGRRSLVPPADRQISKGDTGVITAPRYWAQVEISDQKVLVGNSGLIGPVLQRGAHIRARRVRQSLLPDSTAHSSK
jgi:hypothetical protein